MSGNAELIAEARRKTVDGRSKWGARHLVQRLANALEAATAAPAADEREALYDLWSRHGSSWESDSSEGWELADAILAAGFRRPEPVTPEPDEFRKAVVRERVRQIKKGYTAEHDADHGPDHLIRLAINYAARGKSVQAAAVMEALRDLLAHPPVTPETETEWEYGTGLNGPRGYRRTAGVPAVPPGPWLLEENWGV